MDAERQLQPAFALCGMDWELLWASPGFREAVPGIRAGDPLAPAILDRPGAPAFPPPGAPECGAIALPPAGDGALRFLRWAAARPSAGPACRVVDLLRLPRELCGDACALENSMLELLLDSIHDGIWIIDGQGVILRVNRAMQRIADIRAEEVVGRHVREAMQLKRFTSCVTLHALDARATVTMFDDYANGRHCLNTSTPIFDSRGNVVRVIAIIRDLTELEDMSMRLEAEAHAHTLYSPEAVDVGGGVIGVSAAARRLGEAITMASRTDAPILLLGETGTGKTMAAKNIHLASARRDESFISINCGAIPASLLESELFGYDAGAFTGALRKGKKGVFEMADRGTLLLDEIGELPLEAQATLLNVLDGEPFRRVGGTASLHTDVRIIAATNRSLKEMVEAGAFRKDLFYRLRVIAVEIPPLRERSEDIPVFLDYFLKTMCDHEPPALSASLREALLAYRWPGNVRELRSVTRFLLALGKRRLLPSDLPAYLLSELPRQGKKPGSLKAAVEKLERGMIAAALRETGSTYKAARLLRVSQSTIVRKAQRYHIRDAALIEHE